ncbi:hypothetical protein B296_00035145 [Ensete ventricosum]|uniref:Uncharacterized protein n=1 Tax=Ensete ventricosum TaxID=4639 RepID=A0A427A6J3_ENSVE|nr:hypothetical protein B296_00035145 [Ensete ventricosum]
MSLTEEELEVALTLDSLPELFLASVHRAALHVLPDSLRWGFRKPRSLPGHPLMSSPPPPPLRDGEKNDDRGVTATATSSPSTPLSFQGSGGSEVRPRPWEEHRKRDIKWVEEQHETMASCADGKANLERVRYCAPQSELNVSAAGKDTMGHWRRYGPGGPDSRRPPVGPERQPTAGRGSGRPPGSERDARRRGMRVGFGVGVGAAAQHIQSGHVGAGETDETSDTKGEETQCGL